MKPAFRTLIIVCLATTALSVPARAQSEVPPAVAAILKNWEQQMKLKPTYESIQTDASGNVTITNMSASIAAQSPSPTVKMAIGKIEFEDISDQGGGLYEIGGAAFSGMTLEVSGADGMNFTIDMPEGTVEDWYVKDPGDNPSPRDMMRAAMNVAKKMSMGKISITAMGQTITADGYQSTWDGDPATGAGTFASKLSNVVVPESTIAMADPTGTLKQLGYSGLTFDIEGGGKMDLVGENLGFDVNFAWLGKDMGALKFSVSASDIPLSAFGELQKAQSAGAQPDFNALLPQLQAITFNGFMLRFEDASITKKLLPLAAAMQGMDEATMVANAGAMLQLGLAQLNNQAFTQQVVEAVNAFLKDPKSLTVAVKPPAPVKVIELMSLNPADPGAAIAKLGVSVSAND